MKTGQRVRLRRDVSRYPHFVAPAGALGVVTNGDPGTIHVHLDDQLSGAEEWDNEVIWDMELMPQFFDDVELVPEFMTPRDVALTFVNDLLLRQFEFVGIIEDDHNENDWRAEGTQAVNFRAEYEGRTFLVTVEDITDPNAIEDDPDSQSAEKGG